VLIKAVLFQEKLAVQYLNTTIAFSCLQNIWIKIIKIGNGLQMIIISNFPRINLAKLLIISTLNNTYPPVMEAGGYRKQ